VVVELCGRCQNGHRAEQSLSRSIAR